MNAFFRLGMVGAHGFYRDDSAKTGVPLTANGPTKQFFPIEGQGFGNTRKPRRRMVSIVVLCCVGTESFALGAEDGALRWKAHAYQ